MLCGAWLGQGCGSESDAALACVNVRTSALYFADAEPQELELSAAERSAIGMVVAGPTMAICTGVLISRSFVLTAAHCDRGDPVTFRPSGSAARTIPAVAIEKHPTLDAMLIELESDVATDALGPIAIWGGTIDDQWVGARASLAGVGETETGDVGELRFVTEEIVEVSADDITVDGMGLSGACVGDSGGPLLVGTRNARPAVAGLLDVGSGDCVGVDVYLRADRLVAWVDDVVGSRCEVE